MKNNFFLWPKNNKFISFKNSFRNIKSNDVENLLLSYFQMVDQQFYLV